MVIKGDIDTLKPLGALSFCLSGIGLAVTTGQFDIVGERSQQGTRIEAIGRHNVRFGAQQQRRRDQVQEGQKPSTKANTLFVALEDLTTCAT
jgi:hypothetical protein